MRKLIAVWAAKLSAIAGRMIGKKSSSTPGTIALKICPDLIEKLAVNVLPMAAIPARINASTILIPRKS